MTSSSGGSRDIFLTLFLVVAGLGGCASGRALKPDEPVALGPDEGLLVIGADTNAPVTISLCRDEIHCLAAGPLTAERPLAVLAVPAGRYCAMTIEYATSGATAGVLAPRPEERLCVDIGPGALTYPGHLLMAMRIHGNSAWSSARIAWKRRDALLRSQLDASHPQLAGKEAKFVPWLPASGIPDD